MLGIKSKRITSDNRSMDVWSKPGNRVIYANPNEGKPGDRWVARCCLSVGGIYTVKGIRVYPSYSEVQLREVPDIWFNTVLFKDFD